MKKDGYSMLAKVIVKSLILDYYEAIRDGDEEAEKLAYKGLLFWKDALPMTIYEIDTVIRQSLR